MAALTERNDETTVARMQSFFQTLSEKGVTRLPPAGAVVFRWDLLIDLA